MVIHPFLHDHIHFDFKADLVSIIYVIQNNLRLNPTAIHMSEQIGVQRIQTNVDTTQSFIK
ncbi:hypothetical protein D3C73_1299660 [compost metagenome]